MRRHLYVTCYTEGFSHFVTSLTAPVASGWSGGRVLWILPRPIPGSALPARPPDGAAVARNIYDDR